ncbi:MAG: TraR/DksA C4-type zinc finger protein [Actinomycetota bacterium]
MKANKEADDKKLTVAKGRLLKEKEALQRELDELNEGNLNMLQSEMSGETAHDEHLADSGTATFERERDLTLENNIIDIMTRIDLALAKIEKGTYGVCDRCGNSIDPARLKAVHYANMCITCKKEEESKR